MCIYLVVYVIWLNYMCWILLQVPVGIENNKGNIYIGSTSPKSVGEAYYKQFQKDFSMFLKCRAEELVMGGGMVLTLVGRTSEDPSKSGGYYIWELLGLALNTMVAEVKYPYFCLALNF